MTTPTNAPVVEPPLKTGTDPMNSFFQSATFSQPQNIPSPPRLDKELPPLPSQESSFALKDLPPPPVSADPPSVSQPIHKPTMPPPRPLPLRERFAVQSEIPPHRPRMAPASLNFSRIPAQMDLASQDVPSTPSLFSPRATEFISSPFGGTSAGELHVLARTDSQQRVRAADPRSPPQPDASDAIMRHIDDYL